MKGFVFTLDAVFSIVFAATAISVLVYVSYSSYTLPNIQSSEASSLSSAVLSTLLQGLGQGSALYGIGTSGTWPQYGADEGMSFGSPYGPTGPYLLYSYSAPANIIPAPVASGGYVAFASANQLYEINATTGALANNYPANALSMLAAPPVFYRNLLIYANTSGYVAAVSTSNGLLRMWKTNIGYTGLTTPLEIDEGYVAFGINDSSGYGRIYFLDPENGTIVENDPTSVTGNGALVSWIAHHKGEYYIGIGSGKTFNGVLRNEFVNVSMYPSNSFTSYGNLAVLYNGGTGSTYSNLTASYSRNLGLLTLTSANSVGYAHGSSFTVGAALFNAIPSIGGNVTYLLGNGAYFEAFRQGGRLFNVTLPGNTVFWYNYSDIALAYGNAYVAKGNTIYAFGPGGSVPRNASLLATLGELYLAGRGSLADYVLYSAYGSSRIGVYINGSYAPSLHVAKFNGINSYMAVPRTPALSPQGGSLGAMSLCGWYNIANVIGYKGLLFKGKQSPSSGNVPEFSVDNSTSRGFWIYNPTGGVVTSVNDSLSSMLAITANSVGNWYSFCFTYNQTISSYYLNGTLVGSDNTISGTASSGNGALVIGEGIQSAASATASYTNVSVANLQLYNVSLTPSMVSGVYSGGLYGEPANSVGLVGWWPLLGDGNDYSGGAHVGFPTNVLYTSANYIPPALTRSVQVGRSSIPLQLTNNGVKGIYNVSVVVWSS